MQIIYDPILKEIRSKDFPFDLGGSFQGVYSSLTTYTVGQTVAFGGILYICIQNGSAQQPDIQAAYWSVVVAKRDAGPQGEQGAQGHKVLQAYSWYRGAVWSWW